MSLSLRRLFILAWLLVLAAGTGAAATPRALLVGVSELANQPASLWLQAPRNDVLLMRDTLQAQGFAPADITTVADGVAGAALPDAQAIHDALARLLAQSNSGDFVLLYFSGHGTRLRDSTKRYQEPDGLAENFLARDVRGVLGNTASLSGGLRDVDFDGWVRAFLAKNVFVWSVFDTCSAASMTRSAAAARPSVVAGPPDDEVRFRGIRVDQLARGGMDEPVQPAAPPRAAETPRARYVAFFASESHQVTPELRLPRKDRRARPQGLLTWAVAEALQRRPATWRELFDGVLTLYPPVIAELEARFPERELPSPVAEGNLDAALFGNGAAVAVARPVWRVDRAGEMLTLRTGLLDGLVAQQELRVSATLEDGTVRTSPGRLVQVDLDDARLMVPAALRELPGSVLWSASPMEEPTSLALRVRSDAALPPGLSLDYPASIVRVDESDVRGADVRWVDGGPRGQRIELLPGALGGSADTGVVPPLTDPTAVRRRLESLARLKWLLQLHALAGSARLDGFEAAFEVWRGDRLVRVDAAPRPEVAAWALRSGERAVLSVRNTSGRSLNMVVVGVDAQGGLRPVYPDESGETNRFERGTREAPAAKRFELPWLDAPGARLLVLATPASPYSAPRLFGAAPAESLSDVRVRGQLRPESERQAFAAMARWAGDAPPAR